MPSLPPSYKELDIVKFKTFLDNISIAEKAFRIASQNVWKISGLKHDEVKITSVLAWFLNQSAEHGHGETLFRGLIDLLNSKLISKNIPIINYKGDTYRVTTEKYYYDTLRSSRVDIKLEGSSFFMIIEVKIKADDTNNQLDRYIRIAEKKCHTRPWKVIYLAPDDKVPDTKKSELVLHEKNLVVITWKELARSFIQRVEAQEDRDSNHYMSTDLVTQFADFVSQFKGGTLCRK